MQYNMAEEITNGVSDVLKELYGVLELMAVYMLCLGTSAKKNGKMWEFFPSGGPLPPLPPVWEPHVCEKKGLFCILGH